MTTSFRYVPTSGPIDGASFISQTEIAINELGGDIDTVKTTADTALNTANSALATAGEALVTGQEALTAAQKAQTTADTARTEAATAQSTGDNAQARADDAYDLAATGVSDAGSAQTAADTAQATADQALTEAKEAQSTADQAVIMGESAQQAAHLAMGVYTEMDEPVEADEEFDSARKWIVTNTESTGFPLPAPLYLTVVVAEDGSTATQTVWSLDGGPAFSRTASITLAPPAEEGEVQEDDTVIWSEWFETAGKGDLDTVEAKLPNYVLKTRNITTVLPLTGGGSLENDLALSINGASEALPDYVVQRDKAGRAKVTTPENEADIATKGYVDKLATQISTLPVMLERIQELEASLATKLSQEEYLQAKEVMGQCLSYPEPIIPIDRGDCFVSEEILTGWTWIDGRPIYRRFYDCGGMPPHGPIPQRMKRVPSLIYGLDQVTRFEGYCIESNRNTIIPINSITFAGTIIMNMIQGVFMRILQHDGHIEIYNNSNQDYYTQYFSNGKIYILIEYVKYI